MVNLEREWLLSFMLAAPDYRLRNVIIEAIGACGGNVYQIENSSVTQGVNHCVIHFNDETDLFAAVNDGPEKICKAASAFLDVELNYIEL